MMRLTLMIAGVIAVLHSTPSTAGSFGDAPWCAVLNYGAGDMVWDCEFPSAAACAPNVIAGNRGFCNINPRWSPPLSGAPAVRRHSHHHHYQG
jgi:hypothetical protein